MWFKLLRFIFQHQRWGIYLSLNFQYALKMSSQTIDGDMLLLPRWAYLHVGFQNPNLLYVFFCMGGASCSLNSCRELSRSTHDTPGYLADTEHTHPPTHTHTHTLAHIQSFWVMGTRRCAHAVFILYGFLFECVLLTGLLMASSFPGQGSVIRPYPGHARRAGGTRKNEVSPPSSSRTPSSKVYPGIERAALPQDIWTVIPESPSACWRGFFVACCCWRYSMHSCIMSVIVLEVEYLMECRDWEKTVKGNPTLICSHIVFC